MLQEFIDLLECVPGLKYENKTACDRYSYSSKSTNSLAGLLVRKFPPGRLIAHIDKTARGVAPIKYSYVYALCTGWQ